MRRPNSIVTKRQRRAIYAVFLGLVCLLLYWVVSPSSTLAATTTDQQQQQPSSQSHPLLVLPKQQPKENKDESTKPFDEDDIHIVFSTGCNLFQHWQAEVLLHSHQLVGQRGKITRVVSGCDTEGQKRAHGKFLTHPQGLSDTPVSLQELSKSSHPNFRLHVTPSFPGAREFPWINKPMGLNHWLQHANPPVTESTIVVLDPDMFFMDKLVLDGSRTVQGDSKPFGDNGILMTAGQRHGKAFGQSVIGLTDRIQRGRPVAQTYGLGGAFVHNLNASAFAGKLASSLSYNDAAQYYSVGPPMMAHLDDMRKIFDLWTHYMHPVFNQHPGDIQADMYAYSFAACDHGLPHLMFDQYMVSSPQASGEAWPFVREFQGQFVCSNPNAGAPKNRIPTFLHLAQRYDSQNTDFMFHKGHIPPNIFQCELPLLRMPPEDVIESAPTSKNKDQMYMMCNAFRLINSALLAWKERFCAKPYNTRPDIMVEKRGQRCDKESLGKTCWNFARVLVEEEENVVG